MHYPPFPLPEEGQRFFVLIFFSILCAIVKNSKSLCGHANGTIKIINQFYISPLSFVIFIFLELTAFGLRDYISSSMEQAVSMGDKE